MFYTNRRSPVNPPVRDVEPTHLEREVDARRHVRRARAIALAG
jgi:hypothetical protein